MMQMNRGLDVRFSRKMNSRKGTMHQFPRQSAENEHILTNEWNNSFVDKLAQDVKWTEKRSHREN